MNISDMQYRLSGGSGNLSPSLSLGGAMSSTQIAGAGFENLFDHVSPGEATSGDTEYRCLYVVNTHATDTFSGVVTWIGAQTSSPDTSLEIGLDPAGIDGTATTVADESTAPAGVTFSAPATEATGLSIGNLGPGQFQAVWLKRITGAGAADQSIDDCQLRIQGVA